MNIGIVGGGISGLATAFFLKHYQPSVNVTLFEAEETVGGMMKTQCVEEFYFEEGANGFLSSKPDILELVHQSGATPLMMQSNPAAQKRFIFREKLYRFPESPRAFLQTPLLSWRGKLRAAMELFVARKEEEGEESVQAFGYRRLGKETTDAFLDPMAAGVFASTPDKLSLAAAFPEIAAMEMQHGSLLRGLMAKQKKEAGRAGELLSFHNGVSSFLNHLAAVSHANVFTQSPVAAITKEGAEYCLHVKGDIHRFDHVVLATPAYQNSRLVEPFDTTLAKAFEAIKYVPISVVGLGYRHLEDLLDGFGLLVTSQSAQKILGVLWESSIFEGRVPAGGKSVRVMIGGQRNPQLALLPEAELVRIAAKSVKETMGVTCKPDVTMVAAYEQGIPSYRVGHLETIKAILGHINITHPGLYVAGNAYHGIAVNDCVAHAKACARALLEGAPNPTRE